MSVSGVGQEKEFSTLQISNFLKLCIEFTAFEQEGLLRFQGDSLSIADWYKNLFPLLKMDNLIADEWLKSAFLDIDVSIMQIFKQVTCSNQHFLQDSCGEILKAHYQKIFADYFWPNFLYHEIEFGDTEFKFDKFSESFHSNATQLFMNSIGFLLDSGRDDLAEIMHNTLYIGYRCYNGNRDKNKPFVIGKLLAHSLLLDPFKLNGALVSEFEDKSIKKEATLVAEMIGIAIVSDWFQKPFSLDSYQDKIIEATELKNFEKKNKPRRSLLILGHLVARKPKAKVQTSPAIPGASEGIWGGGGSKFSEFDIRELNIEKLNIEELIREVEKPILYSRYSSSTQGIKFDLELPEKLPDNHSNTPVFEKKH